jgi:hypothetical protein
VVGHDEPEHGVAEELEALVGLVSRVLCTPRPVGQRPRERRLVGERPPEALVQRGEPGDGGQLDGSLELNRPRT